MIDVDLAVEAFRKKIEAMSYAERETYLKDKGFSFGNEENVLKKINGEAKDIQNIWNKINDEDLKQYFITEILPILGYKLLTLVKVGENEEEKKSETIENNVKIIKCIHPIVDFKRMLNLFDTTEEKIKFLVQCREILNKHKEKSINEAFENMTKKLL